uniref:ADAM metallopeptidase with thrombospondin type 1 motif 4 n=1 Tax=Dromaius novaehollandiae TaxID=8790 RepID=A0A8C4JU80_DRONO
MAAAALGAAGQRVRRRPAVPAHLRARVAPLPRAAAALRLALVHRPRQRALAVPDQALPLGRRHPVRARQDLHERALHQPRRHEGFRREWPGAGEGGRGAGALPAGWVWVPAACSRPQTPVDGGWGPWGPWGECSRSCGGGVQFSQRACAKPVPRNGGKYCEGKRAQFRSCNVDACPGTTPLTFREQQCAAYNYRSDLFKGFPAPMDWVPRYSGVAERDQCKLTCQSEALGYYHVLEPRVADGTPCSPESTSVCVQGRCIAAGCDRVIGSKKKFDKCMTCGGDGSGCTKIYGSFAKARYGYNDVVTIPAGATHILVRQISAAGGDDVFLALRRPDGTSLLNGNYVLVPSETDVKLAGGATLRYSGATKTTEMLAGRGPLQEPLVLQALVVNEQRPPGETRTEPRWVPRRRQGSAPGSARPRKSPAPPAPARTSPKHLPQQCQLGFPAARRLATRLLQHPVTDLLQGGLVRDDRHDLGARGTSRARSCPPAHASAPHCLRARLAPHRTMQWALGGRQRISAAAAQSSSQLQRGRCPGHTGWDPGVLLQHHGPGCSPPPPDTSSSIARTRTTPSPSPRRPILTSGRGCRRRLLPFLPPSPPGSCLPAAARWPAPAPWRRDWPALGTARGEGTVASTSPTHSVAPGTVQTPRNPPPHWIVHRH